jgi:hypothetical protein
LTIAFAISRPQSRPDCGAKILAALPERHRVTVASALANAIAGNDRGSLVNAMFAALPATFLRALATVYRDAIEAGAVLAHTPDEQREAWGELLKRAGEIEEATEAAPVRRDDGPSDDDQFHAWVDAQLDLLARDPATFWRWQLG